MASNSHDVLINSHIFFQSLYLSAITMNYSQENSIWKSHNCFIPAFNSHQFSSPISPVFFLCSLALLPYSLTVISNQATNPKDMNKLNNILYSIAYHYTIIMLYFYNNIRLAMIVIIVDAFYALDTIISSFNLHKIIELSTVITSLLQMRKARHREIEVHPQVRVLRVKSELGTS